MCEKRPQFGNRLLTAERDAFEHNAWDNVTWDEELQEEAQRKIALNSRQKVTLEKTVEFEEHAADFWNAFYDKHNNRFFKDRHWLFTEFPELSPSVLPSDVPVRHTDCPVDVCEGGAPAAVEAAAAPAGSDHWPGCKAAYRVLEVGCGVGNTIFPILQTSGDRNVYVYGCDLSETAIELVKSHPDYSEDRCHAFVHDVTNDKLKLPFPERSLDVIVLIFVLSAICPTKMQRTISNLSRHLKPGGLIVFRDYGRYDMAQLRFKDGKCLSENFYVRGDGTRVYFFDQDELRGLFTEAGLQEEQNMVDRRLQVNRGRQLKMYRVWLHCKYRRPQDTNDTHVNADSDRSTTSTYEQEIDCDKAAGTHR